MRTNGGWVKGASVVFGVGIVLLSEMKVFSSVNGVCSTSLVTQLVSWPKLSTALLYIIVLVVEDLPYHIISTPTHHPVTIIVDIERLMRIESAMCSLLVIGRLGASRGEVYPIRASMLSLHL